MEFVYDLLERKSLANNNSQEAKGRQPIETRLAYAIIEVK